MASLVNSLASFVNISVSTCVLKASFTFCFPIAGTKRGETGGACSKNGMINEYSVLLAKSEGKIIEG
jgi:hypothetical protein